MLLLKMEYLAFCSRESCQDTLRLFVQTLQEDINLVYRMIFAFCYSIRREINHSSKQTGSFNVGERLLFEFTARKLSLSPERQTSMLRCWQRLLGIEWWLSSGNFRQNGTGIRYRIGFTKFLLSLRRGLIKFSMLAESVLRSRE